MRKIDWILVGFIALALLMATAVQSFGQVPSDPSVPKGAVVTIEVPVKAYVSEDKATRVLCVGGHCVTRNERFWHGYRQGLEAGIVTVLSGPTIITQKVVYRAKHRPLLRRTRHRVHVWRHH